MIKAKIVADSLSPQGDRLTSLLITFPRIILAELNTHRMLSKNSASSRAIPFEKMVKSVQENPFVPIAWQKEHKGMQGSNYWTNETLPIENSTTTYVEEFNAKWLKARDYAVLYASRLNEDGVTKQLCNRLLEPFMYHTVLITGNVNSEAWLNFFDLRCPQYQLHDIEGNEINEFVKSKKEWCNKMNKHGIIHKVEDYTTLQWLQINKGLAEIHMMQLAECIYDAVQESTPKLLQEGEWHIPYEDKIDYDLFATNYGEEVAKEMCVKISTSMCAKTSYTVINDEKEVSYEKHIELYEKLINQNPLHASPMEHCNKAMTSDEYTTYIKGKSSDELLGKGKLLFDDNSKGWCRNFKGFIQLREILQNENRNNI